MAKHSAHIALHELPMQDDDGCYLAVIEAAAGSRSKCKFEPDYGALLLHSILPLGTAFPYAFGFIPSTCGDDGDPLDILIFLDETLPPGIVVPTRLLGILKAEQTKDGKTERNDRILAAAEKSERYRDTKRLSDVSRKVLERIERFFVFYHRENGTQFKPLGWSGRKAAIAAAAKGHAAHSKR